jgi:three-Cys-motif partner protein
VTHCNAASQIGAARMRKNFFAEQTEESRVKAQIVDKYYRAWAKIMVTRSRSGRIGYVDLFAGPGRYKDGAASVPLLVVQNAIDDPLLRDSLVTIFNDIDSNNSMTLEVELSKLHNIDKLKYKPQVSKEIVGRQIIDQLARTLVPTLSFIDPWGYKGLSLQLINKFIRDWGCECIFFFNYNRINMGMTNPVVKEHMDALFVTDRATAVRKELVNLNGISRELVIVERISEALQDMGAKYVLPFCFKNELGTRTSHYLIFVSKNALAYKIMKGHNG